MWTAIFIIWWIIRQQHRCPNPLRWDKMEKLNWVKNWGFVLLLFENIIYDLNCNMTFASLGKYFAVIQCIKTDLRFRTMKEIKVAAWRCTTSPTLIMLMRGTHWEVLKLTNTSESKRKFHEKTSWNSSLHAEDLYETNVSLLTSF